MGEEDEEEEQEEEEGGGGGTGGWLAKALRREAVLVPDSVANGDAQPVRQGEPIATLIPAAAPRSEEGASEKPCAIRHVGS